MLWLKISCSEICDSTNFISVIFFNPKKKFYSHLYCSLSLQKNIKLKKTSIIASTLALTAAICICSTVICAVRIANAVCCNMSQDSFKIFEISCFNQIGCLDFIWIRVLSSESSITISSIRIHGYSQFLYAVCNYILLIMVNQVTNIDVGSNAAKISL